MNSRFIIIAVILVVGVVLFLLSRSNSYLVKDRNGLRTRIMTPKSVSVSQLSTIFDQLKANHKDASWAAFAFCPAGEPASRETAVNLQYSVENGAIGLDWILLMPRNIADQDKIVAFIKERDFTILEREGNGVKYLRVENGDLVQLGTQILKDFYHLDNDSQMEIFTDGFDWHL
ncbi:MAG TPA: hypothetical protein VGM58_01240 [Verrucomicrobiae bacterium]|jgi:hypothetical protein